ncbi:MAG: CCA tRNA nucleotidyltransferase [Verrucomicrobiota bacterium]
MRETAINIVRKLQEEGHKAYFAGGCVRDELRGEEPKDYDVATSARPEEVEALFPDSRAVGAHFGVILVHENGFDFEIATFRSDGTYLDGRRPDSVTFSSPEEDAQRRDFTINGLFHDPIAGETIDFIGGKADLEERVIRAIGNPAERFEEDHLRLLRAVRFAARFEFEIAPDTWTAVQGNAAKIEKISPERIRDEFSQIFLHPSRVRGFDLLVESGLMKEIVPEILDLQGCEQPPQFHPEGDVFVHTRLMLSLLPEEVTLPLVLSVLFHDIGKPATFSFDEEADRIRFNGHEKVGAEMTTKILRRMKYSNAVIDDTVEMVANHMVFKDVQKMRTSRLKRFMARDTFEDEMELHRVDCLGSWGGLDNYDFLHAKADEFANEPLIPPPLLTGRDLLDLGWTSGPEMGKALKSVQTQQLEGTLTSREEALEWIKNHYTPAPTT